MVYELSVWQFGIRWVVNRSNAYPSVKMEIYRHPMAEWYMRYKGDLKLVITKDCVSLVGFNNPGEAKAFYRDVIKSEFPVMDEDRDVGQVMIIKPGLKSEEPLCVFIPDKEGADAVFEISTLVTDVVPGCRVRLAYDVRPKDVGRGESEDGMFVCLEISTSSHSVSKRILKVLQDNKENLKYAFTGRLRKNYGITDAIVVDGRNMMHIGHILNDIRNVNVFEDDVEEEERE